jgi:hypothetical protein
MAGLAEAMYTNGGDWQYCHGSANYLAVDPDEQRDTTVPPVPA